jgi:DNA-directed RNA polymerase specialized sigma24 family protein
MLREVLTLDEPVDFPRHLPPPVAVDADRLVELCRADDESAFQLLHQRYAGEVRALLLRLHVPQHELDTLTNQVFVTAWQEADRLEEGDSLREWLLGIAAQVAWRGHSRRGNPTHERSLPPGDRELRYLSVLGDLLDRELSELEEQLPICQQVVLISHGRLGMPLESVAELNHWSGLEARARWQRAVESLRRSFLAARS